jgi:two-component system, OmpR family, alkaline phosphatase synthesis response regulator PhoP
MPRILAVDDEPNIVRLIQVNLERHGYQVETANNGAQALAKIRENRPDLLVSDVMMPEMDGFELLSSVRRDPMLQDLPVIMLTAKAQDANVMEGYSRGADMYLTKPFNPAELLQAHPCLASGRRRQRRVQNLNQTKTAFLRAAYRVCREKHAQTERYIPLVIIRSK